jgi:hypothetical protein
MASVQNIERRLRLAVCHWMNDLVLEGEVFNVSLVPIVPNDGLFP